MKTFLLTATTAFFQILTTTAFSQTTNPSPPNPLINSPELQQILIPSQDWQLAGDGFRSTDGPAVNAVGEVFFNDGRLGKTMKISLDAKISEFVPDSKHGAGEAFGPDGRLYAVAMGIDQILAYDKDAKPTVIADGIHSNDLVVAANGGVYVTQSPTPATPDSGKIWYITPTVEKKIVDTGVKFYNGVTLSPDQSKLYADDYRGHWVYSYQIQPDGSLTNKQQYCDLYVPPTATDSAADGLRADSDGRLYVTTRAGVQVCDPTGKLIGILPTPNGRVSNVTFGGPSFDVLYATCGDKVFMRRLKAKGALPFEPPIKSATPKS